jgi:hypothetical protein
VALGVDSAIPGVEIRDGSAGSRVSSKLFHEARERRDVRFMKLVKARCDSGRIAEQLGPISEYRLLGSYHVALA